MSDIFNEQAAISSVFSAHALKTVQAGSTQKKAGDDGYDIRKISYDYIVLKYMTELGIDRASKFMRQYAILEKVNNNIQNNLKELQRLLNDLRSHGKGTEADFKKWFDANKSKIKDLYNKVFKDNAQREYIDKDGKVVKFNGTLMSLWKKQMEVLKDEPGGDDSGKSTYDEIEDISDPEKSFFKDIDDGKGNTFIDWLNADTNGEEGSDQVGYDTLFHAYDQTYKYDHATPDKRSGLHNYLGPTGDDLSADGTLVGGLSNNMSTQMSFQAQTLTSEQSIAKGCIEDASNGKKDMARNQKAG